MSERLDRIEAILEGMAVERKADRQEMTSLRTTVADLAQAVSLDRQEREAERRELAAQLQAERQEREAQWRELAAQREADRQDIAELRNTTTALVETVEIFQRNFEANQRNFEANQRNFETTQRNLETTQRNLEASSRKFDQIMTYVTGLQVENRRIFERVFGPDFDK
ncbi:MAG: hypothetical protein GDA56_24180 [Hormoscilla sp. GM7CHS1pb]|nr:hypothetical protein [Hormoscilla sp. GM7CHS1pb]